MSQRRPPDDEPTLDEPEGTRADGLRSQTRPAQSGSPKPAGRSPQGDWGKTRPLDADAFGSRPTPMRPEPARAFVRGEVQDEAAVRVARAVFAGAKPDADAVPSGPAQPVAAPPATADRTHLLGSTAEPLRVPSNRPAPSPYKNARGASAKATLLMNDTSAGPPRSPAPEPAARPQSPRAPAPSAVSAGRQPPATLPVDQAEIQRPAAVAAPAKGRGQPPPSPRPPATAAIPASAPSGDSEPLRLQLHEGDVLEQPVDAGPPGVPGRSPALMIVLVILAVLGAGAGIWYGMAGSKPAAELPPSRNDLQPATAGAAAPPAEAPAQPPTAVPAAAPAQPVQPAQPAAAAQAPAAEPSAVQPAQPDPSKAKAAAKPKRETAKKPARAKARAAGSDTLGPPPNDDVAAAREALRNLQTGGPVMRVQPTEEPPREESSGPIAPPEPPAPPSPPPPPPPPEP